MTRANIGRRALLQAVAAIPVSASLPLLAKLHAPSIEYVGTPESIDVYLANAGQKSLVQRVASQRPLSLTLDVNGHHLFAVNEIDDFYGLPTGSVESYRADPISGRLNRISRVPLSLSATMPRHLALSPDGRFLVVAAYGGGIYNVLPVGSNGEISGVTQVIKEIGCSVKGDRQLTAHPHSVVFHPSGKFLFSSDAGADRVNVFRIEEGQMTCVQRVCAVSGTGPAALTMNHTGSELWVRHMFDGSIAGYRFDSESESLTFLG